jgi:CheY-like chemotaxis protein
MADFIALAVTGFERHMALEEAKRANKAKSGFLASMSHEIRTPMNAILGITEILVQNEHLPADIREGLDRIYTSCDLLLGIINEILDLSRIEAGKMEIVPAQYSTASMLNDSIQLNLVRLGEKPIEFLIDVCENTPVNLIGDEMRIKQILNNMLSNAIKYTESGKITLSVTTELRPGYEEQLTLVLSVRDTGCGMTKAQLDRVFDEYSRFERNQENFIEGTGLGLAITQRLLRLMGGEIYVESTPGVGSLFVARFPQQTVECDVLGKETASKLSNFEYTANTCRDRRKSVRDYMPYGSVLIVDDVETNRFVAAGLMKLFKLQIETVDSGIKAIDIIKSGKVYDIVFMDHMMPEMDGIEVTGRLRELGYEAPIVALTANVVAGQTDVFLQNGFNDVVAKPIDIRLLTYVLNRFIRDKQPPEVIEAARQMQINETSTDGSDGKSGGAVNAAHAHIAGKLLRKRVAGLDVAKGLDRYNNDVETYLGILTSYANTIDTLLNEIENFSEYKLPYYIIKVHGIKGASYDIYANPTGKVAERLEEAAENSDFEYIRKNNRKFIKATRKFILSIKDTLLDVGAESLSAKKDKPDSELLSKLISACEVYDMDGISSVMTEIEKHQYSSDDGLVNWLREKVKQMSFSEIIEKLSG